MRPVLAGFCTLKELQTYYDFDDLLDLHEILDVKEFIETEQNKAQRQEMERNRR